MYAVERNGYTIFKLSRPIVLCNPEDMVIETGTPYLIFAYGEKDPEEGRDIDYHHGVIGTKKVRILGGPDQKLQPIRDVEYLEFQIANV